MDCRLDYSRTWAIRISHEASMHEDNCFLTLTYDDAHLPPTGSLSKHDCQLFMKKLRHRIPTKIRFFLAGEYSPELERPHYHVCLMNCPLPDPRRVAPSKKTKHPLFEHDLIDESWPHGMARFGELTFKSASYVASYCTKKLTGPDAVWYHGRQPEFSLMSRNPGIGSGWFDRYHRDVFPSDELIVRGKPSKPPRYYLERLPDDLKERVKDKRQDEKKPLDWKALAARKQNTRARQSLYRKGKL